MGGHSGNTMTLAQYLLWPMMFGCFATMILHYTIFLLISGPAHAFADAVKDGTKPG